MTLTETPPASRNRSLLRDLTDCLAQQMIFWGNDARHPLGNRLVRYGMGRVARTSTHQEGTSRYRLDWKDGIIELHGFCAGWYPTRADEQGALYIRSRRRIQSTTGGEPHLPGSYDPKRLGHLSPDLLLQSVLPLVRWWVDYEEWIDETTCPSYRQKCWQNAQSLRALNHRMSPRDTLNWLRRFLENPTSAGRIERGGKSKAESAKPPFYRSVPPGGTRGFREAHGDAPNPTKLQ